MKRDRSDSSSEDFGPAIPQPEPEQPEAKPTGAKRKRVKFEKLFLELLPSAGMYEKSYMHKKPVTHVAVTPKTEFVITGSEEGRINFWKKLPKGIEFVKPMPAHMGAILCLTVTWDGLYAATIGADGFLKIYDVLSFDMISIIQLGYTPSVCCWVTSKANPVIAVASSDPLNPTINYYDLNSNQKKEGSNAVIPLESFLIHKTPVIQMQYNSHHDVMVSVDSKGLFEYWDASGKHDFPKSKVQFRLKTETDLYEFAKSGTVPTSLVFSKDGSLFACMGADRQARIFKFRTGKLYRKYDESISVFSSIQKDEKSEYYLDPIDFGRRVAVENTLEKTVAPPSNVIFDDSGNYIMYSTMLGIKLIDVISNKLVKVIGKVENTERFLHICLFQGTTQGSVATGTSVKNASPDPTIFATAFNKNRFYLFTRREPEDHDGKDFSFGRDVFNEKPDADDAKVAPKKAVQERIAKSAIIHTTLGDIHVRLFGDKCPKTVENFTVHSKDNYYNGIIFHRVIKSFMIQTGDPLGDGTGGTSIWGKPFEDEFHPSLRHDVPFTLSMANAGPGTNGSQFFISTVPLPYLDFKHTVFGRVTKGMDVVSAIERVPTQKGKGALQDRPFDDIKIIDIALSFK